MSIRSQAAFVFFASWIFDVHSLNISQTNPSSPHNTTIWIETNAKFDLTSIYPKYNINITDTKQIQETTKQNTIPMNSLDIYFSMNFVSENKSTELIQIYKIIIIEIINISYLNVSISYDAPKQLRSILSTRTAYIKITALKSHEYAFVSTKLYSLSFQVEFNKKCIERKVPIAIINIPKKETTTPRYPETNQKMKVKTGNTSFTVTLLAILMLVATIGFTCCFYKPHSEIPQYRYHKIVYD